MLAILPAIVIMSEIRKEKITNKYDKEGENMSHKVINRTTFSFCKLHFTAIFETRGYCDIKSFVIFLKYKLREHSNELKKYIWDLITS